MSLLGGIPGLGLPSIPSSSAAATDLGSIFTPVTTIVGGSGSDLQAMLTGAANLSMINNEAAEAMLSGGAPLLTGSGGQISGGLSVNGGFGVSGWLLVAALGLFAWLLLRK